jgi:tRNA modification GTPase
MTGDTIYALSTAPGRAAIAVLRVSGPQAGPALAALIGRALPAPRHAALVRLKDPASGEPIDQGLVLWFPAPRSETGEDVAELQIHGGRATVAALLAALGSIPGLRMAEPGEFARRAFANGKLDLTEVEGLADLVAAETEAQRRQALRQMQGELGRLYEGWRGRLLRALAHQEAAIDFPEETEGEGALLPAALRSEIEAIAGEIAAALDDRRRGERLRDGFQVAILGAPNVGKSSLLNRLARREAAIVSETAGTTRDVIETHLDLGGYPITLADTAGLRVSADAVEREGVRRAEARGREADLRLVLLDATSWPDVPADVAALAGPGSLLILNKIDLRRPDKPWRLGAQEVFGLSAATGEGFAALIGMLQNAAREAFDSTGNTMLTRARHREALTRCLEALRRALAAEAPELLAEDLRLAARALGRITGKIDVEDLLDLIFREFCIGK